MIILGIDGGGTKTHALALDENGTVLGMASGGPSGYHVVGLDKALEEISNVSRQALNGVQADVGIFCLGDCDSTTDHARLSAGLEALALAKQTRCYNDAFAALRAGTTCPYGVAVICGTGFNACGIAPNGQTAKLYALGPLTGDWGGGGALGTSVFGAAYRADDGRGEPTILTEMLLAALNVPDLGTLADWLADHDLSYAQIAVLAPLVFEAADCGDKVAQSIIIRQADEICTSALALLRRLQMTTIAVDVVLAGGIINGRGSLLMERVTAGIGKVYPQARVHRLEVPPVVGAAFLGFDLLNRPAPDATQYKLLFGKATSSVLA